MKIRKLFLYLAIAATTLLFGLAWVGVYQFFLGAENGPRTSRQFEKVEFDITDLDSVLPIEHDEEKLSDPKEDEDNPEYFDPRGFYFTNDLPKELKEFAYFEIWGDEYGILTGNRESDFSTVRGSVLTENSNTETTDGASLLLSLKFEKLRIEDDSILFRTKTDEHTYYSFTGKFLVSGNFYTLDSEAKVLRGTLRKLKNGKILVETEVEFGWTHNIGCCQR
ncbi:MAG: hypothetical protein HKN25_18635 [Pyrinomonadaceae bacterium]|nr:hypothetical protein [Pyrinomonadaceae bacterium]